MARKKLSEYRAKKLLSDFFQISYDGVPFNSQEPISKLDDIIHSGKKYVVKVDEGVKKRFKQGLVRLDADLMDVKDAIEEFKAKGFSYFLIEEFFPHENDLERYLAFERTRPGIVVSYSLSGGVDIEENENTVKRRLMKSFEDAKALARDIGIDEELMSKFLEAMDVYYFSFLEINPLIVLPSGLKFLDAAAEVDSAGEFFVKDWATTDFRDAKTAKLTPEEKSILKLSEKSASSFKLDVLNPDGSIFMLLSGGGVSVALADEVANLGKGQELANYGEYSGNPTEEETYIYTKQVLSLLLKSASNKKVLVIGGGVANFTDVRITFKGIIRAIDEVKEELSKQNVKVFVRRGGPHQKEGLELMQKFLSENNLMGVVAGPEMVLSEIIVAALK